MNTTVLQEKLAAVESLYQYAEDMQEVFLPYAAQVAAVMQPLTQSPYHSDIRLNACMALPRLLYATVHGLHAKRADMAPAAAFLSATVASLIEALRTEVNSETRVAIVESLKDTTALCYEAEDESGRPLLRVSESDAAAIITALCEATKGSQERRLSVAKRYTAAGEIDEAAAESMHNELLGEIDLMDFAVDAMGYVLKVG